MRKQFRRAVMTIGITAFSLMAGNMAYSMTTGDAVIISYAYSDDYLLPTSDSEYLTEDDLEDMKDDSTILQFARNEIFARHGRRFNSKRLQEYFDTCDWYEGTIDPDDFDDSVLNKYEKANVKLIKKMEGKVGSSSSSTKKASSNTYYDPEGNEIEFLLLKHENDVGEYEKYEYEFDSDGRMVKKVESYDGTGADEPTEYQYQYDAEGKLIKCTGYSNGEILTTEEYEYDGNEVKVILPEGEKHRIKKYNSKGQIIREESYAIDGELTRFWDYTYDKDGNLTEEKYIDGSCWSYSYEDGKKVLGSWDDAEGDCMEEQTYEYDKYGNIVTEISWNEGEKTEDHYEYMSVNEYVNQ